MLIAIAILVGAGAYMIRVIDTPEDFMLWACGILAVTWAVDMLRASFNRWA